MLSSQRRLLIGYPMFRAIQVFVISALVVGVLSQVSLVQRAVDDVVDRFDKRPERAILFIGNSRTYFHNMPRMVREIADSAGAKQKYRIVVYAPNGARFEDQWNDSRVQALLAQPWDDVVLQAQSSEQMSDAAITSFHDYGARLIQMVRVMSKAKPVLYVTWRYADDSQEYPAPWLKDTLHGLIQEHHRTLAKTYGAEMANIGEAWEWLVVDKPSFSLYEADGNHPSIHGSYLAALMFYRYFSGDDVTHVPYAPKGIAPQDAALIRKVAQRWGR